MQPRRLQIVEKRLSPTASKRQAILVLGVHRSGTSALGGAIGSLGAAAPKTLLAANFANPRGYWECAPLVAAFDDLLASAGSYWHDWRELNPEWMHSKIAERHRKKIKAILVDEFGDEPLIFIKDPRICRFIPFLLSILDEMNISVVTFLPVRSPLEVAYSLKRRDNIPLPKSLALWLRHVLEAEYYSRGLPRCFLPFERLLIDWRAHMEHAAEATGIIWPARSARSDVKIEQFLTLDLHHERSGLDEIQSHPDIAPLVRDTYNILITIAANGESTELLEQLNSVRTRFNEACKIFSSLLAAEELVAEELTEKLHTQIADTARLLTQVSIQSGELYTHATGMQELRSALDRCQAEAIEARAAFCQQQAENKRRTIELDDLHKVLMQKQADNQELATQLDQQQRSQGLLIDNLDGLLGETNELRVTLASREDENQRLKMKLDAFHSSRSWRLTKPIRLLTLFFRGLLRHAITPAQTTLRQ